MPSEATKAPNLWRRQKLLLGVALLLISLVLFFSFTFQGKRAVLRLKVRHGTVAIKYSIIDDLQDQGPDDIDLVVDLMNETNFSPGPVFHFREDDPSHKQFPADCGSGIYFYLLQLPADCIPKIIGKARQANFDIQFHYLQALFLIVLSQAHDNVNFASSPMGSDTKTSLTYTHHMRMISSNIELPKPNELPKERRSGYYQQVLTDFQTWYTKAAKADIFRKQ